MAHPSFSIEQYVYHFLCQWHVGLQPSLTLKANQNGEISIDLNLTTSLTSNHDVVHVKTPLSRGSGRGSRKRRRLRRAAARSPIETNEARGQNEARNSSDSGRDEDQRTANENLSVDPSQVAEESPIIVKHDASTDASLPSTSCLSHHVSQEPQQLTTEEPAVQCSLCPDQIVFFSKRKEFLKHVCVDNFHEEHLINFPEFLPQEMYQQAMKLPV